MTEKEYIAQKTAFEVITDLAGSAITKSAYAAIWKCARTVKDIPAADVMEVVRCKDCKHYYNAQCYHPSYGDDCAINTKRAEEDFCSYGERKDRGINGN